MYSCLSCGELSEGVCDLCVNRFKTGRKGPRATIFEPHKFFIPGTYIAFKFINSDFD